MKINLPDTYKNRMKEMLKDDYDAYIASMDEDMHHGIRINTSKISVDEFLKINPFNTLSKVPWTENGFYYDSKTEQPAKHPYYFAGLYYIQEPSAMTPASVMPIEKGDKVLDICAAPGGKSTELGSKLNHTGLLISNDISNSRAKALLKNLELFGIGHMACISEPPNTLADRLEGFFDKILVDAPCSGEGMFRKSQSMVTAWENNGVPLFVSLQQGILKEVVKMLKPGGILLYSTCTFSKEEDEEEIEYLLSLDDSLSLINVSDCEYFDHGHSEWCKNEVPNIEYCARLWPHRLKGEGHFVAMVKKDENSINHSIADSYPIKPCKLIKETDEFLNRISLDIDRKRIEQQGDKLFYIPEDMPNIKGLRLLRNGLFLGEVKKNRFEPSQSLAMHLKANQFDQVINLDSDDLNTMKYLKGETIDVDTNAKNGYVLITVDGYPLGWGKNNNGTIKNKYLPGWRSMS